MEFGEEASLVGHFCLPTRKLGELCSAHRPYRSTLNSLGADDEDAMASVDGAYDTVCTLRGNGSLTTCAALLDVDDTCLGDGDCGMPGTADGHCEPSLGGGSHRCTVRCLSDDDCFEGSTCNTSTRLCELD